MNTGVVLWSHAIYVRHLPGGIRLKPGRNVLSDEQWQTIKDHPRVSMLIEAGENNGISLKDLRSVILDRINAGEPVTIVNDLPVQEGVAYVYGEADVDRLKELQANIRFPQVAVAIDNRLAELTHAKSTPPVRGRRPRDVE